MSQPADPAAAEAIRQAALRYCRGVDRLDAELMRSAYHDDALDDHGVFVGSAADLCRRVVESHRRYDSTMHCVLNHAIDIVDDTHATGEVYNVTYLLRTIAGLEYPNSGAVALNGNAIEYHDEALLRHRRSIGTVFQAFNLFPHMTALKNITLPLEKVHGRTA